MNFTNATAIEAEHRIISVCFERPEKPDLVTATPADFFSSEKWRPCFSALLELQARYGNDFDAFEIIDMVPKLTASEVVNLEASPALIGHYSDIVREEAAKRRLRLGLGSVLSGLERGTAANEALSQASQVIREATMGQPDRAKTVGKVVSNRWLELAEMADRKAKGESCVTGITTGIDKLDEVLSGIQRGIPTLLAARPAMGKSVLALNITNAASLAGVGVHVFSLEDTESAYADRVISTGSGVSTHLIRTMDLNRGQLVSIQAAADKASRRKGWIVDDRSGISAAEIVGCARRNAEENKTELIIIDYIQLVKGERGQLMRDKLTDAINIFGDAAKADNVAYLVLSQLNRECEKRDDKRPTLSDLKESGALEERAKACIMLYRGFVYGEQRKSAGQYKESVPESEIELLVRKNSNGLTGTVIAKWQPDRMRII